MTIKILLADDHEIMRDGLRTLLEKQLDMKVVAEAEDGGSAVRLACKLAPDVVIMDIAMPGMNGIEATRRIVEKTPAVKVIALSMHSDQRYAAEMLRAGACGYVQKNCAYLELVSAIRAVSAHKTYFCPRLTKAAIRKHDRPFSKTQATVFTVLTAREREVLQLVAEGKATREIAALLDVSVKTIETHRQQIMKKLDLYTVADLTRYAIREGITSLEF
jgi:DNA-binding NarL/FixJ family response regulator